MSRISCDPACVSRCLSDALRCAQTNRKRSRVSCVPTARMCLYGPHSASHGLPCAIPHKCPPKVVQARTGRSGASHGCLAAFPAQSLSRKRKAPLSSAPTHGWVKNFQASPTRPTPFVGVKFPHPLSARPTQSRGVKNLGVDRARPTLMRVQMGDACRCFHTRGLPHARVRFSSHLHRRGPPH